MENKDHIITWEHAKVAAVIAVLAPPVAFVFSFFYDWGLLGTLGISYSDAPTSISDHMRTGLVWLPTAIITVAIVTIIEFLTIRIEGGRTEEEIINQSANPSRIWKIRNSPYIFLGIMGPIAVLFWILFGDIYFSQTLYFGLTVCWVTLSIWILVHPVLKTRYSKLFKVLFVSWPLIPLVFFYQGKQAANEELIMDTPSHQIQITTKTTTSVIKARIIRSYGDWLLVLTLPDPELKNPPRIVWLKMDNIDRITVIEKKIFPGVLCWVSDYFCPE